MTSLRQDYLWVKVAKTYVTEAGLPVGDDITEAGLPVGDDDTEAGLPVGDDVTETGLPVGDGRSEVFCFSSGRSETCTVH